MSEGDGAAARERFRAEVWEPQENAFLQEAKANFGDLWLAGEDARLQETLAYVQVGFDGTRAERLRQAWERRLAQLQSDTAARFEVAWKRHCEQGGQ